MSAWVWVLALPAPVLLALTGVFAAVCICAAKERRPIRAECIIVPGARVWPDGRLSTTLRNRCDAALKLYAQYETSMLMLCGGQGADEFESEAEAMCRYMLSAGVPRARIVTEADSKNTRENLENAKILMYAHDLKNADIVTSDYHITRTLWLARDLHMLAGGVAAPGPDKLHLKLKARVSETGSWILYFKRRLEYFIHS